MVIRSPYEFTGSGFCLVDALCQGNCSGDSSTLHFSYGKIFITGDVGEDRISGLRQGKFTKQAQQKGNKDSESSVLHGIVIIF